MIMQKVTLTHKDRNAKTVDEFYYKDMEEQLAGKKGTGVRALAGDFIRWAKQIIDVLDQIAQASGPELAETAKKAVDKVKRGIVAYSFYG